MLEGKTILYTGAAGGLGLATTLEFLKAGATVVAVDNDAKKAAELERAAAGVASGTLVLERIDLSDLAALRRRLDALSGRVGGFDVVINNAAIYPSKPFEEYMIEDYQAVQRVNVEAGIVCVQSA